MYRQLNVLEQWFERILWTRGSRIEQPSEMALRENTVLPFDVSVHVAQSLASLVAPTFGGSSCRDQMIVTEGNSVLVTNCGYTVLQAVVVNHPIGAYVLENVRTVDDVGGDGCSAFVLLLANVLRNSAHLNSTYCTTLMPLYNKVVARARLTQLSVAVADIKDTWYPAVILPMLKQWKATFPPQSSFRNFGEFWQSVGGVFFTLARSSLGCSFGENASSVLSNVCMKWISVTCASIAAEHGHLSCFEVLHKAFEQILQCFPVLCAERAPLNKSTIVSGSVLLPRAFLMSHNSNNLVSGEALGEVRFIVITGPLDINVSLSGAKMTTSVISNMGELEGWKELPLQRARSVANILAGRGVNLVICTEKVPEELVNAWGKQKILIVEYLDKEEALYLCRRGNIYPSNSCTLETFHNADIGGAKSARQIVYGGKSYVLMDGLGQPFFISQQRWASASYPVTCPQLLLRAPTSGLCVQYHKALKRVFKMLYRSVCTNEKGLVGFPQIVCGRGYFERRLQSWCKGVSEWIGKGGSLSTTFPSLKADPESSFERYNSVLKRCRSQPSDLANAFIALSRSMGQIVHILLKAHHFDEDENVLETVYDEEKEEWREKERSIFDSLGTKQNVLVQLLVCWHQLLRIDDVVAIRSKKKEQ